MGAVGRAVRYQLIVEVELGWGQSPDCTDAVTCSDGALIDFAIEGLPSYAPRVLKKGILERLAQHREPRQVEGHSRIARGMVREERYSSPWPDRTRPAHAWPFPASSFALSSAGFATGSGSLHLLRWERQSGNRATDAIRPTDHIFSSEKSGLAELLHEPSTGQADHPLI